MEDEQRVWARASVAEIDCGVDGGNEGLVMVLLWTIMVVLVACFSFFCICFVLFSGGLYKTSNGGGLLVWLYDLDVGAEVLGWLSSM